MTWTMGRQLASFGSNTYTYNEEGIRTSKTVDNVKTEFYLDGTNIIEQITDDTVLHFHYDSNDEIIGFTYGENDYFYVKNAMGDITRITDINGNLVASYHYDPWGNVLDEELTAIGELNPFRYRSYYYDVETELYYLKSRYYDPEIGRFINSDDVSFIGATGSEISYNPFAYCENNPVNGWDPSGKLSIVTSMLIGAILGVLGVFILDVMLNLYYGAKTWYGRRSTIVSYISAAISGALSMISIKSGSKLLTASVSAATYALEQLSKGEKISIIMLIITVGFALVLDHVFAGNIDLSNRIGAIKTSRDKLKTLVSAKKITQYKNKIISNISGLIKGTFSTLLNNIISRVADELKILKGAAKKIKGVLKI